MFIVKKENVEKMLDNREEKKDLAPKKITKATLKKFIKENKELFINVKSDFDGRVDCVMPKEGGFKKVEVTDRAPEYTLEINGVWVTPTGNLYNKYEDENYEGIEIYNCCGCQILAIKK